MSVNLENSIVATGREQVKFSFQSRRKKMQKNVQITVFVLISHASKVMLKIFQARLHVNWELPDVKVGFQRGRGTRDQISNIIKQGIPEKPISA